MPFAYFKRLSETDQRIYLASNATREIKLVRPERFAQWVEAVRGGLDADDRSAVQYASQGLVLAMCDALGVERVRVEVLAKRPRRAGSELHGLYTRPYDEPSTIEVWMKTAANRRTVAFRTFSRTLLHEVAHHLDFVLLRLPESFHTEGFFARESSLVRQLLGEGKARIPRGTIATPEAAG